MIENFYRQFDKISAPDTAVEKAVEAAASAEPSAQIIELKPKKRRKLWISATAAVLVIAVVLGVILIPRYSDSDSSGSRFTITANAAALGDKFGSNVIGAFGGEMPFSMGQWDEDKSGEYYTAFVVDALHIEGEDIASVSMYTNIKEFLFVIDPIPPVKDGVTTSDLIAADDWTKMLDVDEEDFDRAKEKEMQKYTDLSMIDSDKTEEELRTGFNGAISCNSFTYRNSDHDNPIKFEGNMMIWMKLTKSDEEMTRLLEETDAISEERAKLFQNGAEDYSDEKWNELEKKDQELSKKAGKLSEKIFRHVFKDGVFTVEVTFTDGTTESKTLKLGTAIQNDLAGHFCWLTLCEE